MTPQPTPIAPLRSESKVSAVLIPRERTLEVWPMVREFLEKASEFDGSTPKFWRRELARNKMQLWVAWGGEACLAAVLTEIAEYTAGRKCNIVACGGVNMNRWLGLIDIVEQWAKSQGCIAMHVVGRKGWARVLPSYEVTGVMMEKRLV